MMSNSNTLPSPFEPEDRLLLLNMTVAFGVSLFTWEKSQKLVSKHLWKDNVGPSNWPWEFAYYPSVPCSQTELEQFVQAGYIEWIPGTLGGMPIGGGYRLSVLTFTLLNDATPEERRATSAHQERMYEVRMANVDRRANPGKTQRIDPRKIDRNLRVLRGLPH